MGYVSKDIAVITEPDKVTLSAVPNFVQFASKPASKTYLEVNIQVNVTAYTPGITTLTLIRITDPSGTIHAYHGTTAPEDVGGSTFYVSTATSDTAENLRQALLADKWFSANFEAVIPFVWQDGNPRNGSVLNIKSKGAGTDFNITIETPNDTGSAVISSNLFNYDDRVVGYLVTSDGSLGPILSNPNVWFTMGYVDVREAANIIVHRGGDSSSVYSLAFYNQNKQFIAGSYQFAFDTGFNGRLTVPDGAVYFRATVYNTTGWQVNKGSEIIPYEDYREGYCYTVNWINRTSVNNDSISGEASTAEIDLDIYADPDVFLGQDDRPISPDRLGNYVTTLQKTYAGSPVWFELNAFFSQYGDYNRPSGTSGWFDTGTSRTYRFTAKVKAINSFYFYQSNALYVLHGYGPASEDLDLSQYVYGESTIKLLTDKPRTPYIRGQREYLNFIFSDPQRGVSQPTEFTLQIAYRAYTTSDNYLGTVYGQEQTRADFAIVNTCQLDIDAVLDQYPTAGIVRVALARGTALVSNDLEYTIRPECLHTLRQFSFINRLGGWDAFNFDAGTKDEIKPSVETYNKTLTPSYQKGDSIETVYNTTLANTFTIEGAPVTDDVAAWLKELAAARVILDNDGNYIIIEDFTLQVTAANKNMQKPTIKYRLSE